LRYPFKKSKLTKLLSLAMVAGMLGVACSSGSGSEAELASGECETPETPTLTLAA
jgi:hypothetical protein